MKKMILLCAAAIMAFGASAQMSLVKDLAKKAGSADPQVLAGVLEQIEPALMNPESANDVLTWFTAGKAAFGIYDAMFGMKALGQPVDDKMMNEILSAGYEFYLTALPLDSVVEVDKKTGMPKLNADGTKKVKTKYSKDIIGVLTAHMGDIANAGNIYLQNSDWENAADAFGNYADLASSDFAIKNGVAAPDSTLSQVRFFQGYSQYQIQKFAEAYENFTKARKLGYTDNNVVDFQTSSLANMVQGMLDANDFAKANAFIDNALKGDPMNGTLNDIKGFVVELEKGPEEGPVAALPYYRHATEVDPNYANGYYDVGRCLYLMAQKIVKDNPNLTDKDLFPKKKPLFDEAIPFLQKAISLNPNLTKAQGLLDEIMYSFELNGVK